MTVDEFSREFDIYYNSIATNAAPSIDTYEKSVYLTKAQLEIIKNYFNPQGNKYQEGFEQSSKRRNDLKELIKDYKTTLKLSSTEGIDNDSQFFKIPNNVFIIIQEKGKVVSADKCVNGKFIKVKPITHDEYNINKDNPFKRPSKSLIWRLDYFSQSGSNKNIELISKYNITDYNCRYIIYPSPIVLGNFNTLFPGEGLTVDGVNTSQTCKLSDSIHREILDRAVELATADYRPEMLNIKAQMGLRNE